MELTWVNLRPKAASQNAKGSRGSETRVCQLCIQVPVLARVSTPDPTGLPTRLALTPSL